MRPHVDGEGGLVGKLFLTELTVEARSTFRLGDPALEVGQHVLLQGTVGDEFAATGSHWAFEGRLARMGQPVEVQALLGHAAVTTQVALQLWRKT